MPPLLNVITCSQTGQNFGDETNHKQVYKCDVGIFLLSVTDYVSAYLPVSLVAGTKSTFIYSYSSTEVPDTAKPSRCESSQHPNCRMVQGNEQDMHISVMRTIYLFQDVRGPDTLGSRCR
jgi:hypothetical protein